MRACVRAEKEMLGTAQPFRCAHHPHGKMEHLNECEPARKDNKTSSSGSGIKKKKKKKPFVSNAINYKL